MRNDIEEMLKKIGSARPQEEFSLKMDDLPPLQPTKEKQNRIKYYLIPAVAAVLIVAVIGLTYLLPFSNSQNNGQGDTVSNGSSNDVIHLATPNDDRNVMYPWELEIQSGDSSPESNIAPWESGKLKFTTLTLSGRGASRQLPTAANGFRRSDLMYLTGGTDKIKQDNKQLSLMADTEIRSCINGRWLGIYTEQGKHAGCEGLFYDIQDDCYVCVACKLNELIRTNEYYVDACVRTAVEVYCMKNPETPSPSTSVSAMFPKYYKAFYKSDALKVFASGEKPTKENTKLDFQKGGIYHETWETTKMDEFKYPVVKVLEYGQDINKCFFALVSPDDNLAWGSFVYDFAEKKLYSLNGDTVQSEITIVGNENFMYHYGDYYYNYSHFKRNELIVMAELAYATNVTVSDDYRFIAVSAPYFATRGGYTDPDTGIKKNAYEEDVVFLVDIEEGTCKALYDTTDSDCSFYLEIKDTDGPWPSAAPEFVEGEICFPTKRGTWRFDYKTEYKGDLLKIATRGMVKYVFMQQENGVRIYKLSDSTDVTAQMQNAVFDSESYPKDQNNDLNFLNNESGSILDGKYVATASKSGRFVYLFYEHIGQVLCVDTKNKTTQALTVDTSFIDNASKLSNITYQLFVSDDGENLILTYCNGVEISLIKGKTLHPHVILSYFPEDEYLSCYMVEYDSFDVFFSKDENKMMSLNEADRITFIRCVQILSCDFVVDIIKEYESIKTSATLEVSSLHKKFNNKIDEYCEEVAELVLYNGESIYMCEDAVEKCLDKTGRTMFEFKEYYGSAMEHPIFY